MEIAQEIINEVANKLDNDFQADKTIQNDIKEKNDFKLRYDILTNVFCYISHEFSDMTVSQCIEVGEALLNKYVTEMNDRPLEPTEENFYTIQEVADKLGYHHNTIRKAIKSGKLKAIKMEKEWRITESSLKDFLNN